MERFNAMGREFNINNEVMCRIDDGEYVMYEDARIAIDTKQDEIDALKVLLHVESEANTKANDEIDRLRAEVERLNGMRHYADGVPGYTPNGCNVSQAQLDKIHFDRMQDWED